MQQYCQFMNSSHTNYWTVDRIMHLILGCAVTVALVWLIGYLQDALLPFFIACFIAYLLQPLVEFNRRWTREKGRIFSSLLTVVEVLAVMALFSWLFVPQIEKELDGLGRIIHGVADGTQQLSPESKGIIDFVVKYFNPDSFKESLSHARLDTLLSGGSSLLTESVDILMKLLDVVLTLIYILFILIDYPQIVRGFKLMVPARYRADAMEVVHEIQVNLNHYFRGQGFVALCAMVLYCVGFTIVEFPLAIPMGVLVGVLYMIPYFQYITLVPVAVVCFIYSLGGEVSFVSIFGRCLLVYAVSQGLCDYVITPRVMGKQLGLNPAVILLSLAVWGSLLGIIGMIIALPFTSLIMVYYERYISNPRKKKTPAGGDTDLPTGA